MKTITREEANLTTWLLGQVGLVESQTGRKVEKLELTYDGITGENGINLILEE
ncbi:hypothetical protein HN283_14015 [Acinetobacter baumannii]|uniref:hypothetical protein n=1 Tax=Acinetobacter baumannii TaxID=470 RepID=UPI00189B0B6D|nr:hypothetical protein [Acinetobacter baumannii]MBF6813639.1 hypothetical protein [Acinetobacter baumannii]MBF6914191.1 hypothetical protein [Acinetobacter baumannii]MBF6974552.1 hypothetical protein [Acinetobacter baumannii]